MINYYLLTKPGIIFGNLLTVAAGFLLGGSWRTPLFCATLLGLALVIASSCVWNNFIDRNRDRMMERTKKRALASGLIANRRAIFFALILGIAGNCVLFFFVSLLALAITNVGFFVYIFLYSLWKGRTVYATLIGSIAGGVPPVVGYVAASGHLDLGALLLFSLLILWQMPHFFAIAIYHLDDYKAASIPVLPATKGIAHTCMHMMFYIVGFLLVSLLFTLLGVTGPIYLTLSLLLGTVWLFLCLQGFRDKTPRIWARTMFRYSLVVISVLCIVLPFG